MFATIRRSYVNRWWKRLFGPRVETSVDDVGEVALEGTASFSLRLSFGDLALQEDARSRVDAGLGDRDAVEAGVDLAVAAAVEAVAAGVEPEPQGIGAEPPKRA